MDLQQLSDAINGLENTLDKRRRDIGKEIIRELQSRLKFLLDVGLDYLNLNRSAKTLSGGEKPAHPSGDTNWLSTCWCAVYSG